MRALETALAERLAGGCTTLCRCWQVTRRDGVVLGFTDHDRDLSFDGVTHRAASALSPSVAEASTGLSVDSQTVAGALQSEAIDEADIRLGLYDGAGVQQWLVDWQEPDVRLLLGAGTIGEIRAQGQAFEAEILGLAEAMNRPMGRAYVTSCDSVLGDTRCGIDLTDPAYRAEGVVLAANGSALTASGLTGYESGWFTAGSLEWLSGANTGAVQEVRTHALLDEAVVETWTAPPFEAVAGDRFVVTAGCDKRMATCRDRFANLVRFRGFPHMPGDDWATGYPTEGDVHDGGSLNRS
ncbi:MAG: DUF2163 domain-containing protein [Pseudomonadota bacterium]